MNPEGEANENRCPLGIKRVLIILARELHRMDEATSTDAISVLDEIEATVRQAAGKKQVVLIRLAVGKEVTVSKVQLAKEMHRRFPDASLELLDSKDAADSIVVKDIEVE
jgi:hypothetical protein